MVVAVAERGDERRFPFSSSRLLGVAPEPRTDRLADVPGAAATTITWGGRGRRRRKGEFEGRRAARRKV